MKLNLKELRQCLLIAVTLFLFGCSFTSTANDTWKVKSGDNVTITVMNNIIHDNDPSKLFGFNINHRQFQVQLWDQKSSRLKDGISDALLPFQGSIFRYPGGLVSNSFHWRETIGEFNKRKPQSSYFDRKLTPVSFGVDEYLTFLSEQGGQPWYVLNIVGLDPKSPMKLADLDSVAENNVALVKYLLDKLPNDESLLYLQLGNELDRARYQWTAEEYSHRAKFIVDRIQSDVKSSRIKFVSFQRDFNWTYKNEKKDLPVSKSRDFLRQVETELNSSVENYSLHHYYDGNRIDGKSRAITFWLKLLANSIRDYRSIQKKDAQIWITEHGRQPMSRSPGSDNSVKSTSNTQAAISTADYLIALSQFKEVKGAVWHGLNAGPWQLFDYSVNHKDLRPRPIYWGLSVLRALQLNNVLETHTVSKNISDYAGGYDVRAVATRNEENNTLGLKIVNRASSSQQAEISYKEFSGAKVVLKHYSIALPEGRDPEYENPGLIIDMNPEEIQSQFDASGSLNIVLPPSSVSNIEIKKT